MSQNEPSKGKKINSKYISAVILCALPWICSIVFRLLKLTGEADMKVIMRLALLAIGVYGLYKHRKKQLNAEGVIFLIMLAGCALRIGYTLYTHAFIRGYDIGMNNAEEGTGHWGYIYHIINGHLPPSNEYQFYQPPLYYLVCSVFIRIMMLFKGMNEWGGLEYIPQLVSCSCSIAVMLTTSAIMNRLNIKKSIQIIPMALLAVYPAQILASSRMNNDSMVQMFMILSLYATLRWHQSGKLSDIIFIALSIGFGMMTKISCGIIALITGPVMIYHFVKTVKSGDKEAIKNIVFQLIIFAAICFPLGLWYGIRNWIKFDQPLTYVYRPPEGLAIYTGNESWVKRWIVFPLTRIKGNPYSEMGSDCNIWMLLIRSGVHGEFTWEGLSPFLAWMLNYTHAALMLMTLWAMGFSIIRDKGLDKTQKYAPLIMWIIVAVSYIQFNISYKYSCTPDFRYVFPAQIAASFYVAYFIDYCFDMKENKRYRYTMVAYGVIVSLFAALSIMHFC